MNAVFSILLLAAILGLYSVLSSSGQASAEQR